MQKPARIRGEYTLGCGRVNFLTVFAGGNYSLLQDPQLFMKLIIPIIVLVVALPVCAQISLTDGPSVDGIKLGATYKAVVAKFGKPLREKTNRMDECIGDRTRTVNYPGLSFDMAETDGVFTVYG